jgi:hypothetical protein
MASLNSPVEGFRRWTDSNCLILTIKMKNSRLKNVESFVMVNKFGLVLRWRSHGEGRDGPLEQEQPIFSPYFFRRTHITNIISER